VTSDEDRVERNWLLERLVNISLRPLPRSLDPRKGSAHAWRSCGKVTPLDHATHGRSCQRRQASRRTANPAPAKYETELSWKLALRFLIARHLPLWTLADVRTPCAATF